MIGGNIRIIRGGVHPYFLFCYVCTTVELHQLSVDQATEGYFVQCTYSYMEMATKRNLSARDEKFGEKSTDYSTICVATMSEENTYASVVADEVPPTDAKKDVHVRWLAVFASWPLFK